MPAAVAWAVAAIGAEIGGTAGAFLIMNAVTIGTVVTAAAVIAYGAEQQAAAARRARDAYNNALADRLLTVKQAVVPSRIVLGRVRVSGALSYAATTGEHKEKLAMVIALAHHEIDAVEAIWFNDQPVILDADGWVLTAPYASTQSETVVTEVALAGGAGSLTLPHVPVNGTVAALVTVDGLTWDAVPCSVSGSTVSVSGANPAVPSARITYQHAHTTSYARVLVHLGSPDQVVDPVLHDLLPADWTALHRGRGVAFLACLFDYSPDAFPQGLPTVSATLRGAKCYDPRDGGTRWTECPALLARHYALSPLGGRRTTAFTVDEDAEIAAAANVCDRVVGFDIILPDGHTHLTITEPLYTAGLMATTEQRPIDVLAQLAQAMAGKIAFTGNRLRLRAGDYLAPVIALGDDDFARPADGSAAGGLQLQPRVARDQLFNVVAAKFVDPAARWQVVDLPDVIASAYVAEDGATLPKAVTFDAVTRPYQAQQICAVMLRQARQALTLTATFKLSAYAVELFDTVALTCARYGWVDKPFEVLGRQWTLDSLIQLTLRETHPSIYALGTGFDDTEPSPNTLLPNPWQVPVITGLAATGDLSIVGDGTPQTRVRLTWDAVTDPGVTLGGEIEVQYTDATLAVPSWQVRIESGSATATTITGLQLGRWFTYRVRAVNGNGVRGRWSTQLTQRIAPVPSADAAAAAAAAEAARLAADAALAQLAAIASDAVLTRGEKPAVIIDWTTIANERAGIDAQADNYAVTAERTAYDNAITALANYLDGLAPGWNNLTADTPIVGADFRARFAAVYAARQALLDKIAANAKARLGGLATLDAVDTPQIGPGAVNRVFILSDADGYIYNPAL